MALWLVFSVVSFSLFGAVVWVSAAGEARQGVGERVARTSEEAAWWRLVWPLFAGVAVIAFLAGWASREPDPADEWVTVELFVLAAVVGTIALRAAARACRSAIVPLHVRAPIATLGLFQCRVVVSEEFEDAASPEVLAAALAHEAAHVRGRDPLRIWLAQLAVDLQWPVPRARRRFRTWALALEMRRDDEALLGGASPTALAESIILAARLSSAWSAQPPGGITGQGDGLALRVRRLLVDTAGRRPSRLSWRWRVRAACIATIVASVALGAEYGDAFLSLLPGVGR